MISDSSCLISPFVSRHDHPRKSAEPRVAFLGQPLPYLHDALRSGAEPAQPWLEGVEWEGAPTTRPHPFALYLPTEDAQAGRGLRAAGRLTVEDVAPLLPDDPGRHASTDRDRDRRPDAQRKRRELLARKFIAQVGAWDWAIDDSLNESAPDWERRQASVRADELDTWLRKGMSRLLTEHLMARVGKRLERPLSTVWLQLVARGITTPGIQVCDGCSVVFDCSHGDARRCPRCWGKRAPKVYPARDGGRHISIRVLPDGSYEYMTACTDCGGEFPTKRADAERCPKCKPSTARSRLSRERARSRHASDPE